MSHDELLCTITKAAHDGVLFDMDGVITKTATVHAAAWKKLFDEYLEARADGGEWEPFDIDSDYRQYVDGKPRYDGVKSFLESRGIELPYGSPDDAPGKETVCGLGNRKNELFHEHLKTEGVDYYKPAEHFLRRLKEQGFRTAIVSSSKNCADVMDAAGIAELFDVRVDGIDSERLHLKGKPEPDIFLEAARRLDLQPARAVVLEDAISGVEAGRRGNFASVIGVDRIGQGEALRENGADIVVTSLAQIGVSGAGEDACERRIGNLASALDHMSDIQTLMEGKRLFVALDYDGTLTPIVERPELAVLSEEMRGVVSELARQCPAAVISGRDRADVERLVNIDNIYLAGSHGFDVSGPEGSDISSQKGMDFLPELDRAEQALHERLDEIEGVLIERKKYSIAIHYRQVREERIDEIEQAVDAVRDSHSGLRKETGKKIFELQPAIDWHKGKALLWLLDALGLDQPDVLPIYIGDDVTDENAFRTIRSRGLGIVVKGDETEDGDRFTAARYALESPAQVQTFIATITRMKRGEKA